MNHHISGVVTLNPAAWHSGYCMVAFTAICASVFSAAKCSDSAGVYSTFAKLIFLNWLQIQEHFWNCIHNKYTFCFVSFGSTNNNCLDSSVT